MGRANQAEGRCKQGVNAASGRFFGLFVNTAWPRDDAIEVCRCGGAAVLRGGRGLRGGGRAGEQRRFNANPPEGLTREESMAVLSDFSVAMTLLRAAADLDKCGINEPLSALLKFQVFHLSLPTSIPRPRTSPLLFCPSTRSLPPYCQSLLPALAVAFVASRISFRSSMGLMLLRVILYPGGAACSTMWATLCLGQGG